MLCNNCVFNIASYVLPHVLECFTECSVGVSFVIVTDVF